MDPEIEAIRDRLRTNSPRCVRDFRLAPADFPELSSNVFKTVWGLSCPCGGTTGAVLGFSPGRFIPDYDPARVGPEFLSPLAFVCSTCRRIIEMLDTDLHGYHCEVQRIEGDSSGGTKYRGEGKRDRFACGRCGDSQFRVVVGFVYWDAAIELMLEEPDLPGADLFNEFLSVGICTRCGGHSRLTAFGKL